MFGLDLPWTPRASTWVEALAAPNGLQLPGTQLIIYVISFYSVVYLYSMIFILIYHMILYHIVYYIMYDVKYCSMYHLVLFMLYGMLYGYIMILYPCMLRACPLQDRGTRQ